MSFGFLGDSTLPLSAYDKMINEAMHLILVCYRSHCQNLTQVRQEMWKCLTESRKLCSLPPTSETLTENTKRAHLQLAIWHHALDPDPINHGWTHVVHSSLNPTVVPQSIHFAPDELISLTKCSCASATRAFKSGKCSSVSAGLTCTLFYACKAGPLCHNKFTTSYFNDD